MRGVNLQQADAPETVAKSVTLVLLSVSDYKRAYTSSYFIVTTSTWSINPQVKVGHGGNSPEFTL